MTSEAMGVESGQRREWWDGEVMDVISVDDTFVYWTNALREGRLAKARIGVVAEKSTLLGGPTPALGVPVVMGERKAYDGRIYPVACLSCGGDVKEAWYHCRPCFDASAIRCMERNTAWKAGARDFPRPAPATPQPEAPPLPPHQSAMCGHPSPTGGVLCRVCLDSRKAPHQQRLTHGHTGELCTKLPDGNWQPRSALQIIQARKPPEPWVPTVDEWDLLPDAGR